MNPKYLATGPLYYSSRGDVTEPRLDFCLTQYLNDGEEYAYLFLLLPESTPLLM